MTRSVFLPCSHWFGQFARIGIPVESRSVRLTVISVVLPWIAGCTTPVRAPVQVPKPVVETTSEPSPVSRVRSVEGDPSSAVPAERPGAEDRTVPTTQSPSSQSIPAIAEGQFVIVVESDPTGATIVVDGKPVGRAPRRLVLPVTPQGFSRETVSIKARFVAETSAQQSMTTEVELTPLDRLPSVLVFTREKVLRKR
jgi:hypothetical protein